MAKSKNPKLNIDKASELLEGVFEKCEVEPNTVPVKELASYSNFRLGTYYIQRGLIVVLFVIMFFLPTMFIYPRVEINLQDEQSRGFPVYSVDVRTLLGVKSVIAYVDGKELPVYPCDSHLYTIEPSQEGMVSVEVTLFNGLTNYQYFYSGKIDNTAPIYTGVREADGIIYFYFEDDDSGISAKYSYLTTDGGTTRIKPIDYSENEKYLAFEKPDGPYEIVVSNLVGEQRTYKFGSK